MLESIYNQYETGLPKNNKPPNVVALKKSRNVVSMINEETWRECHRDCMCVWYWYLHLTFVIFKGKRTKNEICNDMPVRTKVEAGFSASVANCGTMSAVSMLFSVSNLYVECAYQINEKKLATQFTPLVIRFTPPFVQIGSKHVLINLRA
ncbi:hypothetical protein PR048_008444 [Dryococelus australis]|uniref:Uncharacterized protein n=1 Tax=Dryococelus australis TaxID=614101 RepID=A0ABQ9HX74_9NEOP|nr:hypothetical protein PR048_008444 [Dryococelus australis]